MNQVDTRRRDDLPLPTSMRKVSAWILAKGLTSCTAVAIRKRKTHSVRNSQGEYQEHGRHAYGPDACRRPTGEWLRAGGWDCCSARRPGFSCLRDRLYLGHTQIESTTTDN